MKTKVCSKCGKALPYSQFLRISYSGNYRSECRPCSNQYSSAWKYQLKAPLYARMLDTLNTHGEMSAVELALEMEIPLRQAAALARVMFAKNLLDRSPHPTRRAVFLYRLRPGAAAPAVSANECFQVIKRNEKPCTGIDEEDLAWMAHYRAQAAARQARVAA